MVWMTAGFQERSPLWRKGWAVQVGHQTNHYTQVTPPAPHSPLSSNSSSPSVSLPGLVKTLIAKTLPTPRVYNSLHLGGGLEICISNEFSSDEGPLVQGLHSDTFYTRATWGPGDIPSKSCCPQYLSLNCLWHPGEN